MGEVQKRFGGTYPYAEYREFAATDQGTNVLFAPEGTTPGMYENSVKKGGVKKNDVRASNENILTIAW